MEVFVGAIPYHLDSAAIERFIYAVVQKEQNFGSSSTSIYTQRPAVAAILVNKGFYFKRIERKIGPDFGIITFARERVGAWFVEYAQVQPFVLKHNLRISRGRQSPTKALVNAIAENATVQQPSASVQKHAQVFALGNAHVGHWSAPNRFNYTHSFTGQRMRLVIDETNVLAFDFGGHASLSFLPRDVRSYGHAFLKVRHPSKEEYGSVFLFELKQNPQLKGSLATSEDRHGFRLPSKVIRIAFGADKQSAAVSQRLYSYLDSLLTGVPVLDLRPLQMVEDNYGPFLARFFQQSKTLDIDLAFLRESLLRNELVNLSMLSKLICPQLDKMVAKKQQALAVRVLKNLIPKLELRQERGKNAEQVSKETTRLWDEACAEAVANDENGLITFFEQPQSGDDNLHSQMLHIDVTPTRILLSGPQFHVSNRVIRAYPKHWHHFARVMFTNEDREGVTTIKPNYGSADSEKYIQTRVLNILKYGIFVAGRHWELLAWSASSMSTHTVWFVTPFWDEQGRWIDANAIRASLGDFSDVKKAPALYGARLSQAFSATAATITVSKEHTKFMPDIVTNKDHVHTDGVGQISPSLMAEVWERYVTVHGEHRKRKLLKASAPSAIQIRLGGSKGVLAINPRLTGKVLYLRPSMYKFGSQHQDLEVANSSARCLPARLNRPLINALGDLGVPATALLKIQEEAISDIGRARSNFAETARLCSAYSFGTGCNLRILFEKIHKLGLGAATVHSDSFFLVLAKSVTAAALGDMKRKARIPTRGVTLLCIADEFAFLKEGEIFAQTETVEQGKVTRRVLVGRKLIGRSPTVDPGDVALVQCVKPPPGHPLLQLRNVVVFNTCSRLQPLPRRLGGGDCDGDVVTIYEDERLFPASTEEKAVFPDKVKPLTLSRDCHPHDLADFFADFMLNDLIGVISHMHLRIADSSEAGSEDFRCKELAKLHSQATDFRKTGVAVTRNQLPRMSEPIVPDFLAQGEPRVGKLIYSSKRVLGYLFRAVGWNETDTPSLDSNTDPETGLERVPDDDEDGNLEDDGESSQFGSEFSSLIESQVPALSSVRATVGPNPSLAARLSSAPVAPAAQSQGASTAAEASPWSFKDFTFPQLLERIYWSNRHFLPAGEPAESGENEADVVEEGTRYVVLFQHFTRALRHQSRNIAAYHPNASSPQSGHGHGGTQPPADGVYLVSEVHLLTGRLPWAKVAKRTRTDRDNSLLDSMQSLCTLLRKNLCRISESAAAKYDADSINGQPAESGQILAAPSGPAPAAAAPHIAASSTSMQLSTDEQASEQSAAAVKGGSEVARATSVASSVVSGDGSAAAPFELDLSDDEQSDSTSSDDFVILGSSGPSPSTPRAQPARAPLAIVTNTVTASSTSTPQANQVKRKASQEVDQERRSRSHTPTPLHPGSFNGADQTPDTTAATAAVEPAERPSVAEAAPAGTSGEQEIEYSSTRDLIRLDTPTPTATNTNTANTATDTSTAAVDAVNVEPEDDEEEEGELTSASAQRVVESLWRACRFFCSARRPRYSNMYGYHTFMITLTLHLLSMLETVKHLYRDQHPRRYFAQKQPHVRGGGEGKGKGRADGEGEVDTDDETDSNAEYEEEEDYSLTADTMAALDLSALPEPGFDA